MSEAEALFGDLLREYRVAAGLTQEALAERAGLSARGVSDLERGLSRAPRLHTLSRLAEALGLGQTEREDLLRASGRLDTPSEVASSPLTLMLATCAIWVRCSSVSKIAAKKPQIAFGPTSGPGAPMPSATPSTRASSVKTSAMAASSLALAAAE